jgi:transcriptional regulator with XRE-family HTH domain
MNTFNQGESIQLGLFTSGYFLPHSRGMEKSLREPTPNRIQEWRKRRELSQEQLANAVNTTKAQISKLEKGDRQLTETWMKRLASVLGCMPHELMIEPIPPAGSKKEELLKIFDQLGDKEQEIYLSMGEAFLHGKENKGNSQKPEKKKAQK